MKKIHPSIKIEFKSADLLVKVMVMLLKFLSREFKPVIDFLMDSIKKRIGGERYHALKIDTKKLLSCLSEPSITVGINLDAEAFGVRLSFKIFELTSKVIKQYFQELRDENFRKALDRSIEYKVKKLGLREYYRVKVSLGDRHHDQILYYKTVIRETELACSGNYSKVESRLIRGIDKAIQQYELTGEFKYYVRFTQALNVYNQWLDQKIYRSLLELNNLKKTLVRKSFTIDFRKEIRMQMRFLFKNLDDYHSAINNTTQELKRFYYLVTGNYHEQNIYRTSY